MGRGFGCTGMACNPAWGRVEGGVGYILFDPWQNNKNQEERNSKGIREETMCCCWCAAIDTSRFYVPTPESPPNETVSGDLLALRPGPEDVILMFGSPLAVMTRRGLLGFTLFAFWYSFPIQYPTSPNGCMRRQRSKRLLQGVSAVASPMIVLEIQQQSRFCFFLVSFFWWCAKMRLHLPPHTSLAWCLRECWYRTKNRSLIRVARWNRFRRSRPRKKRQAQLSLPCSSSWIVLKVGKHGFEGRRTISA